MRRWIDNLDRPGWKAGLLVALLMGSGVAAAAPGANAEPAGRVPKPALERGQGDKCVEDTEFMRKNHMSLLKHQRDETVHNGIRTKKYSLTGCIDCHASRKTGHVVGSDENFCQSCHSYAAVKLDCFECHASKPGTRTSLTGIREQGSAPASAATPNPQPPGSPAAGNLPKVTVR